MRNRHTALGLALLLTTLPALASRPAPQSLDDLVAQAQIVARARVVHTETQTRDAGRVVETLVDLSVDGVIGGAAAPGTVRLVVPGGVVGGRARMVLGAPWFREGQEYFLLLREEGGAGHALVSLLQAAFRIRQTSAGPLVANDLAERAIDGAPDPGQTPAFTANEFALRLTDAWSRQHGGAR